MTDKKYTNEKDCDAPFQKAVAIKNEEGNLTSSDQTSRPHITAKGTGKLAERILDIAFEKGVKVRQDKELTNLLEHFDVESPIPLEALDVVSDILRHVYIANDSLKPDTNKSDGGKETEV
jgi:flagellar biosynthesis protein